MARHLNLVELLRSDDQGRVQRRNLGGGEVAAANWFRPCTAGGRRSATTLPLPRWQTFRGFALPVGRFGMRPRFSVAPVRRGNTGNVRRAGKVRDPQGQGKR